jgi:hypothetical protein
LCTDKKWCGGLDRVDGDLQVAFGAVLEADRRREARRQLAVHLAFGGAGADRAPGDQVTDVLRADHVEKLAAGRHAHAVDVQQQLARDAQAFVDAEALIEVGVVDQAFPAHGGARLLEVHAHHDFQRVGMAGTFGLELARVVHRRFGIVDRARADDHEQTVVAAGDDPAHVAAGARDQRFHRRAGHREKADQVLGRRQRGDVADAFVVGGAGLLAERMGVAAVWRRGQRFRRHGLSCRRKKTAG